MTMTPPDPFALLHAPSHPAEAAPAPVYYPQPAEAGTATPYPAYPPSTGYPAAAPASYPPGYPAAPGAAVHPAQATPAASPYPPYPAGAPVYGSDYPMHAVETESHRPPDAYEFLMNGWPSVSFDHPVGYTITGKIIRKPEVVQRTEYGTNRPMFWPDGRPQWQLKIVLQIEEFRTANDRGIRVLYARYRLKDAIRAAVDAAQADFLHIDGTLTVTYIGDLPPRQAGAKPPKDFAAWYVPPVEEGTSALTPPSVPPISASAAQPGPELPAPSAQPTPPISPAPPVSPALAGYPPVGTPAPAPAWSGQPLPQAAPMQPAAVQQLRPSPTPLPTHVPPAQPHTYARLAA
ncbi:hypothetical protein [Nonomuraea sp. NPDC049695]|uniref:hypothetical protein n=1 Tax=Nonomuraea sp. NPDC049695 TaxID=3154734 RepID=UPI00342D6DE7